MAIKLKAARQEKDLRQEDLGRMLGVGQSAVAAWETKRARPNWTRRRMLEQLFPGHTAAELLEDDATDDASTASPVN